MSSYKAVARMYALASLLFRDLYYTVSIKICGGVPQVYGVGRAQRMLRSSIWVGKEGRGLDAVF